MNIVTGFWKRVKRHFTPSQRQPQPFPQSPKLTLFEALDRSLAFGYASVNWEAVNA